MTKPKALPVFSRREFVASLSVFSGIGSIACAKKVDPFTCMDVSAVSEADRNARVAVAYADRSPTSDKECVRCVQYIEVPKGCGTCKIVRGPIHPSGTCRAFAAKTT
jgi:hypothetical protein